MLIGATNYRARYYDPNQTRFTQRDPLGFTDGINPYSYVHNNPVNFNDPSGLLAKSVMTFVDTQATSYVNARNELYGTIGGYLDNTAKSVWNVIDPPGPHEYDYKYTYCNNCSASMVANISNYFSVPFNEAPPQGHIDLLGNNPIEHTFNGTTWVNATLPGHIFDGQVVGTTSTAANGDVSVDVRGTGNGFAPGLNNAIGAFLFGVVLPVNTYINVKYDEVETYIDELTQ